MLPMPLNYFKPTKGHNSQCSRGAFRERAKAWMPSSGVWSLGTGTGVVPFEVVPWFFIHLHRPELVCFHFNSPSCHLT